MLDLEKGGEDVKQVQNTVGTLPSHLFSRGLARERAHLERPRLGSSS